MTTTRATHLRQFPIALLLGAGAGALFLGVGGRQAMHAFALATVRSASFTLGGSLSVVMAGAIAGVIGGLLLVVIERFMPQRLWLRGVLFAAICYLIATPGIRPPRAAADPHLVLPLLSPPDMP